MPHPKATATQPMIVSKILRIGHPVWLTLFTLCLVSGLLIVTTSSQAVARFGTRCQRDFQNGWQVTLDYQWDRCNGFND